MHDGDHPERLFIGRICNQVFAYHNETQGPRGEVRAAVAPTGKQHKVVEGVFDFGEEIGAANVVKLAGNFLLTAAIAPAAMAQTRKAFSEPGRRFAAS